MFLLNSITLTWDFNSYIVYTHLLALHCNSQLTILEYVSLSNVKTVSVVVLMKGESVHPF